MNKSQYEKIAEARDWAEEFVKAAEEAMQTAAFRKYTESSRKASGKDGYYDVLPRANATVKRRSMDLTHALAELRKS